MTQSEGRCAGLLRWLPAIAWMAMIFALSSVSGLRVSDDVAVDRPLRTLAHFTTFAVLAALLLYALCGLRRPGLRQVLVAYGLTLAYAFSDELHQAFVRDRNGRLDDVIVDAIGAALGLAVGYLALRLWTRLQRARGQ